MGRFRKLLGGRVLEILGRDEPAWEIALSFAVGVAISFSPFLGLHWAIGLLIAWIFRLNKVDVLIGTLIPVNPWTLVPIYSTSTYVGWFVLHSRAPGRRFEKIPWSEIPHLSYWEEHGFGQFRPYLSSFILGSAIFSVLAGLTTYVILVNVIRHHRAKRATRMESNRADEKTSGADSPGITEPLDTD